MNDINTNEELKCAYCPHNAAEHVGTGSGDTSEENSSKTGLCKVFGCECIQFTAES